MGISRFCLEHSGRILLANSVSGRVLQLGRQDLPFGIIELTNVLTQLGLLEHCTAAEGNLRLPATPLGKMLESMHADGSLYSPKNRSWVSDVGAFRSLGFTEVAALDASKYENADVIWDMNLDIGPALSAGFTGFDLCFDGGTMEHVFNTPLFLANIFKLLKVGGYIMHWSPTNNYVDHGLYQFSPTFFADYYATNGYRIVTLQLIQHSRRPDGEPWLVIDYRPGSLDHVTSIGGLGSELYITVLCAQKVEGTTFDKTPTQGLYRRMKGWQ